MTPSDSVLVGRVLDGDNSAFDTLMKRHEKNVKSFVSTIIGWSAVAEDIDDMSQNVFLKAFTKLGTFNGRSTFKTWLLVIAKHEALDFLRKQNQNLPKLSVSLDEMVEDNEVAWV